MTVITLLVQGPAGEEHCRLRLAELPPLRQGASAPAAPRTDLDALPHAAEIVVGDRRLQVCPAGTFACSGGGEAVLLCIRSLPARPPAAAADQGIRTDPGGRERPSCGLAPGREAQQAGPAPGEMDYLFDAGEEEGADDALFP